MSNALVFFDDMPRAEQASLTLEVLRETRWSIREGDYKRALRLLRCITQISERTKGTIQRTAFKGARDIIAQLASVFDQIESTPQLRREFTNLSIALPPSN